MCAHVRAVVSEVAGREAVADAASVELFDFYVAQLEAYLRTLSGGTDAPPALLAPPEDGT